MEVCRVRTDLALESAESMQGPESEMSGVSVSEEYHARTDVTITTVMIVFSKLLEDFFCPLFFFI